jgi:hypothetical protein
MSNAISEIVRFQTDRKLDRKQYNAVNEHGSVVEELFESIGLDVPKENRPMLKKAFRNFIDDCINGDIADVKFDSEGATPHKEKADAYCDVIVFAVGAIMKLGYDPERALIEVGKEINSREGIMLDGKWTKNKNQDPKTLYKADYDNNAKLGEV